MKKIKVWCGCECECEWQMANFVDGQRNMMRMGRTKLWGWEWKTGLSELTLLISVIVMRTNRMSSKKFITCSVAIIQIKKNSCELLDTED